MAITGFTISDDISDYNFIADRYNTEGLDMFFYDFRIAKNIKLGEMKRREILDYLIYLNIPKTYSDKAWYKILNDVLIRQRKLKIGNIKKKIDGNSK